VPAHDRAGLAASGGTIAADMVCRTIGTMAGRLMAAAMPGSPPLVAGENATRPGVRALFGRLTDLPSRLHAQEQAYGFAGSTSILVGSVAALATAGEDSVFRAA
jgi:siroheme synthase